MTAYTGAVRASCEARDRHRAAAHQAALGRVVGVVDRDRAVHAVEPVPAVPLPQLGVLLFERLLAPLAVQVPEERDVGLRGDPERHLVPDGVLLERLDLVHRGFEQRLRGIVGAHESAHHLHQPDEPGFGHAEVQQGVDRLQLRLQLVAAGQVDRDLHARLINAKRINSEF